MSDLDRDREPERIRDTERTTVIDASGGGGGGDRRGLAIVAIILLLGIAAVLFFVFRSGVNDAADEVGVNVSLPQVDTPDINVNLPDVNIPSKIEIPDVDVKTSDGDGGGNKAE
jgi:hypothetical protein